MKLLLLISLTLVGILRAQNNIQVSVKGNTLYSKCMMVSEEVGYFDANGTNVLRAEQDMEPLQIFFKNWVLTFDDGEANTRYELYKLTEINPNIVRYSATFYGFAVKYKPRPAQVKLNINPKRIDLTLFDDEIYRKYRLSFMP